MFVSCLSYHLLSLPPSSFTSASLLRLLPRVPFTPTNLFLISLIGGNSQDGQLGIGASENVLLPTPLDFPEHKAIESVASGPSHTLLVDSEGLVYS